MNNLKLLTLIILVGFWTSCGKDDTPPDPCTGVDENCSELAAENFEMLCNAQNLTVELTVADSSSPFECRYKIRNDDGVILLLWLSRYSSCVGAQNQFDFNKEFFQNTEFIPIDNLNDDSHYYETSAFRVVQSVKGKTLIDLTGYNDTDCGSQEGLIELMRGLNDKLF